jgi:hypothetical protein
MMRSGLLVTICVAVVTVSAGRLGAQDISLGGRLGAVAGIAWFDDDESNDVVKPLFGFQIGGAAEYRWTSNVSLQAELWYVQKGWKETPAGGGRRLSYVELPLFVTVTAPWRTAPHLVVGASASLEVGCAVVGVPEVGSVSCDDPRVEWKRPKAQLGAWAGFGVRRRLGASHLDVQLLGNFNLTNLNRELLPRGRGRLISLIASAAYMIPVGGRTR